MKSSATRPHFNASAVLAVAAAAILVLLHSTVTVELAPDMSVPVYPAASAGPVSFTRFVCCSCYDRGPDWIAGTFFGTRRAAELHISRSSVCRGSGKGVKTITQEYRESKRAEDQEAGPVGAPGTWPARSAGKHDIVPDVCITNRTRYRYMEDINW